jgi:hypothetical protein
MWVEQGRLHISMVWEVHWLLHLMQVGVEKVQLHLSLTREVLTLCSLSLVWVIQVVYNGYSAIVVEGMSQ